VAFAERREPLLDAGAKNSDGGDAECAGDVHRSAVVAYQHLASLNERNQFTQSHFRRDNSTRSSNRVSVSLRLDKRQHFHAGSLGNRRRDLYKPVEWPPLGGDTGSGMNPNHSIIGRDSVPGEKRRGPASFGLIDLQARRCSLDMAAERLQ